MKNTKIPVATPIAMLLLNKKYYIASYDISMQYEENVSFASLSERRIVTGRVINLLGNAYPTPYLDYQATIGITRVKNENTGDAFVLDFESCGEVLSIIEYAPNVYRLPTNWVLAEAHFVDSQDVSLYKTLEAAWEEADINIYTEGYKHHSPEMIFLQDVIVKKTTDGYEEKKIEYLLKEYMKLAKILSNVLNYSTDDEEDKVSKKEAFLFEQIVTKELVDYLYQKITDSILQNGKILSDDERSRIFALVSDPNNTQLKQFEDTFFKALSW